jgi:hypothetical protein
MPVTTLIMKNIARMSRPSGRSEAISVNIRRIPLLLLFNHNYFQNTHKNHRFRLPTTLRIFAVCR